MNFPRPQHYFSEPEEYTSEGAEQHQDHPGAGRSPPFPQRRAEPIIPFPQPDLRDLPASPSRSYSAPPTYGYLESASHTSHCLPPPRACTEPTPRQAASGESEMTDRDRGFGDEVHRDLRRVKRWAKRTFLGHDHGREVTTLPPTGAPCNHGPNHHPIVKPSLQEHQSWPGPTPGPSSLMSFPMPNASAHIRVQAPYPNWPNGTSGHGYR